MSDIMCEFCKVEKADGFLTLKNQETGEEAMGPSVCFDCLRNLEIS